MAYEVQFICLIKSMFQNFADIDDHPQIIFNSFNQICGTKQTFSLT